jgi:hypothetical protein
MPVEVDPVNQFVARQLEKHTLPAFHMSARESERTFNRDEYNCAHVYGTQLYYNRLNRLLDIAKGENSLEPHKLDDDNHPRIAIRHASYGLIVLFVHRVDAPEYLPRPGSAEKARMLADVHPSQGELFAVEQAPLRSRVVGVVCSPYGSLEEVVVGNLVQTGYGGERMSGIVKLNLDAGGHGSAGGQADETPPPEPETGPSLTLVQPAEGGTSSDSA